MLFIYLKSRFTRSAISFVMVLLIAILGWFACLYFGFISSKEAERDNAYSLPVEVVISNIQGTKTDGLGITGSALRTFTKNKSEYDGVVYEKIIDLVPYFSEIRIKSTLYYETYLVFDNAFADMTDEENSVLSFVGITSLGAIPDFDPKHGTAVATFFDEDDADFSDAEDFILIVPETMIDNIKQDDGSIPPLDLNITLSPKMGNKQYKLTANISGYYSGTESNTVYCSWELAAQITEILGQRPSAESISAIVADNTKLDELREQLKHFFGEVNPSGVAEKNPYSFFGDNYRYAAIVHDETLRETLGNLNRSINTLKRLLPIVIALELAISAVSAYFYIHIRKRELAIARSLGTPRKTVLGTIMLEMLVCCVIASVIAVAVSYVIPLSNVSPAVIVAIGASALIGTAFSGYQSTGRTGLLSLKEEN